jgi:hypothetical protein
LGKFPIVFVWTQSIYVTDFMKNTKTTITSMAAVGLLIFSPASAATANPTLSYEEYTHTQPIPVQKLQTLTVADNVAPNEVTRDVITATSQAELDAIIKAEADRVAAEKAAQAAATAAAAKKSAPAAGAAAAPNFTPNPGSAQAYAQTAVASRGWGSGEFNCLVSLWKKESGWNAAAMNKSSGAYGIPQALPGSKMASAGADWQTNANTQIEWGLGYISGRYGTPCGAWAHSGQVGWY